MTTRTDHTIFAAGRPPASLPADLDALAEASFSRLRPLLAAAGYFERMAATQCFGEREIEQAQVWLVGSTAIACMVVTDGHEVQLGLRIVGADGIERGHWLGVPEGGGVTAHLVGIAAVLRADGLGSPSIDARFGQPTFPGRRLLLN